MENIQVHWDRIIVKYVLFLWDNGGHSLKTTEGARIKALLLNVILRPPIFARHEEGNICTFVRKSSPRHPEWINSIRQVQYLLPLKFNRSV